MVLFVIGVVTGAISTLLVVWLRVGFRLFKTLTPQEFGELMLDKLLEQRGINMKQCGRKCRKMLVDHAARTADSIERFQERHTNPFFTRELTEAADFAQAYCAGQLEQHQQANPYFEILRSCRKVRQIFESGSRSKRIQPTNEKTQR